MILVILAAGMGTRYGGLKQMDSVSEAGDSIMDFSIYDALQSGFDTIVLVIRKATETLFRTKYDPIISKGINIKFVFQEVENIPSQFLPVSRSKPWGTGHAVLSSKSMVSEKFAVINADDFYGRNSFLLMQKALKKLPDQQPSATMVGYYLKNTVSKNGAVSRGECYLNQGFLTKIIERTHIETQGDEIFRFENDKKVILAPDTVVSMNFWGYSFPFFDYLEQAFHDFLSQYSQHPKMEFFLPSVVDKMISTDTKVPVSIANEKWLGITYAQDKKVVVEAIKNMKETGIYPKNLWA